MENVKVQSKYFFSDSSVYTSYFPLFCVFAPTALEMEHKGDKTKPSRMRVFILSDFRKYFKQNEMSNFSMRTISGMGFAQALVL